MKRPDWKEIWEVFGESLMVCCLDRHSRFAINKFHIFCTKFDNIKKMYKITRGQIPSKWACKLGIRMLILSQAFQSPSA